MMAYREHLGGIMMGGQKPGDVVDVIVECIEAQQPRLRYPTSDLVRGMMAQRYREDKAMGSARWYEGFTTK